MIRWRIPQEAIAELRDLLGALTDTPQAPAAPGSEALVQQTTRAEFARSTGGRLWRNNVGAVETLDGRHVRFGLANDSRAMNARIKSADLIGLRPVVVGPEHIGATFGLFVARECKRAGWKYRGTPRERAQLRFLELVASLGGDAKFVDDVKKLR